MMSKLQIIAWFSVVACAVGLSLPAHADLGSLQQIRIGVLQHDTSIGQGRIEPGTDLSFEWIGPVYQLPESLQIYDGFGVRPVFGYTGNFGGARTEEIYGAIGFDLLPQPYLRVSCLSWLRDT